MTLVPGCAPATGFSSGMTRAQYVAATIANYGLANVAMLALADTAVVTSGILADYVAPDIGPNWTYNASSAKKADLVTIGGRKALLFASATPTSYSASALARASHVVLRWTGTTPPATERWIEYNTTGTGVRVSVNTAGNWAPSTGGTIYQNNSTSLGATGRSAVIDSVASADPTNASIAVSRTGTTTAFDGYLFAIFHLASGFIPSAGQRAAQYALDKKYFSGIGLP